MTVIIRGKFLRWNLCNQTTEGLISDERDVCSYSVIKFSIDKFGNFDLT